MAFPALVPILLRLVVSYLPQNTTTIIQEDFLCCALFKCPPLAVKIALASIADIRLKGDINVPLGQMGIYLALKPLVDITRCPPRFEHEGFCDYICQRW